MPKERSVQGHGAQSERRGERGRDNQRKLCGHLIAVEFAQVDVLGHLRHVSIVWVVGFPATGPLVVGLARHRCSPA